MAEAAQTGGKNEKERKVSFRNLCDALTHYRHMNK